jgi:predicted ArsR family transcriptional regulator
MAQCAGTKRNNERCTATVEPPQTHCWWHDPANAEERRRAASKGGRGKPSREIRALKRELEDLAASVLAGRVDRGNAAVVNQILNTRARLIELERKVKETEELEERIERLEQTRGEAGGKRWAG